MDYQEKLDRWMERAVEDGDLVRELAAIRQDSGAVSDRFYQDLRFGTGGLRGVIGAGTNRMNIYTVRRATQGHRPGPGRPRHHRLARSPAGAHSGSQLGGALSPLRRRGLRHR